MERIFIILIALYALFVAIYFLYLKAGKKRKKNIVGKGASMYETTRIKTDIIGKSQFDFNATKPLATNQKPVTSTPLKSENPPENTDTFVPSNETKSSTEVPSEQLDETFSDTLPDEDNEPMDIDYPLEYETEEEYEEEETEDVEGTAQAALASGVLFEDLGNAVRTVNKTREATSQQRRKAGNTLLEIRHTDLFEQLVSGKPDAKKIVADLMAESLADFYHRKDKESGTTGSEKQVPDNFNIRDFA